MPRLEQCPTPAVGGRDQVEEVGLLLAPGQLASLEQAARRRGLSAARLLRRLVDEFLRQELGRGPEQPR